MTVKITKMSSVSGVGWDGPHFSFN